MPHSFIWHELSTTEPTAAASFYGAVLGWTTRAYEAGSDYRVFHTGEQGAAGLRKLPEPEKARGSHWSVYVHVDDVDAEARSVVACGGSVCAAPQDIPGTGRFAVVADPQGAVYMIMSPLARDDAPATPAAGTPGFAAWHDLQSTDWPAAMAFYGERYGWTKSSEMSMGPRGTYALFANGGVDVGGMMNMPDSPPMWLAYFAVADIDAAKQAIEAAHGTILHGPAAIPGGGFIIHGRDPQGAMFAVTGPRGA